MLMHNSDNEGLRMKQEFCVIMGAGEYYGDETIPPGAFIIAADGGLEQCKRLRMVPDVIIGDFDSLAGEAQGNNVIKLPKIKDDTDTVAAVKYALEQGFHKFLLLGCTGGRLSHTVANLQTLTFIAKHAGIGFLVDKTEVATATCKGMEFDSNYRGFVSVFAAEESVTLTQTGLKYTLQRQIVHAHFPLGVSNEFIGEKACIQVHEGCAWIVFEKPDGDWIAEHRLPC